MSDAVADMPPMDQQEADVFLSNLRRLHPHDLINTILVAGSVLGQIHGREVIAHRHSSCAFIYGIGSGRAIVSEIIDAMKE